MSIDMLSYGEMQTKMDAQKLIASNCVVPTQTSFRRNSVPGNPVDKVQRKTGFRRHEIAQILGVSERIVNTWAMHPDRLKTMHIFALQYIIDKYPRPPRPA